MLYGMEEVMDIERETFGSERPSHCLNYFKKETCYLLCLNYEFIRVKTFCWIPTHKKYLLIKLPRIWYYIQHRIGINFETHVT